MKDENGEGGVLKTRFNAKSYGSEQNVFQFGPIYKLCQKDNLPMPATPAADVKLQSFLVHWSKNLSKSGRHYASVSENAALRSVLVYWNTNFMSTVPIAQVVLVLHKNSL